MQSLCCARSVRRESQTAISFSKFQPLYSIRSSKPRWRISKEMRRSSNALSDGQPVARVAIDRSDAKITVRSILLSACIVHAEWTRV